jgi:hypothetical protein
MEVVPNAMYSDKFARLSAIRVMAQRAATTTTPKTPNDVSVALEEIFCFCGNNNVPITLGGFCLWCGVTQTMVNKIERDTRDISRAEAFHKAKECIRVFLEMCAFDGTLNPILWFHSHKTEFGAIENQTVTIRVEDNQSELTSDEFQERVSMLRESVTTLRENEDGSFGPETD